MSRAARLLDLLQAFRRHKRPVSGASLAEELGVSLRTIYRDIEALKAQGAAIDGEAGVGFVLKPGFTAGTEMTRTLQDFVKQTVAPYKYPRAIEYRDALPRTDTGKLQRFRLKQPA